MFAGYGTDLFALKKLEIDFESVGFSEIDKYAIQCFQQNHGSKNYGNCREINPNDLPDFDLLTGGFPCQSFSNAGQMKGELDPRGTLFYEIIRIAEVKKPKYMLLENVKGLTSKKFKETFDKILNELDRIGYNVKWKVLNSKDYGTPQNRERVWFVCIRKDIEQEFKFPEKEPLNICLKDLIEEQVEDKYYLSESQIKTLQKRFEDKGKELNIDIKSCALRTFPRDKVEGEERSKRLEVRKDEVANSITTHQYDSMLIHPTLTTELAHSTGREFYRNSAEKIYKASGTLRKLTPKECFRLMGFYNDEINLEGLSDTQKYKLAGNGQDVNVVSRILRNLICYKEGIE